MLFPTQVHHCHMKWKRKTLLVPVCLLIIALAGHFQSHVRTTAGTDGQTTKAGDVSHRATVKLHTGTPFSHTFSLQTSVLCPHVDLRCVPPPVPAHKFPAKKSSVFPFNDIAEFTAPWSPQSWKGRLSCTEASSGPFSHHD